MIPIWQTDEQTSGRTDRRTSGPAFGALQNLSCSSVSFAGSVNAACAVGGDVGVHAIHRSNSPTAETTIRRTWPTGYEADEMKLISEREEGRKSK